MFSINKRLILSTLFISVVGLLACSQAGQTKNSDGPVYVKKDSSNPELAAKIFGKDFTYGDLEKSSPDIFTAKLDVYEAQKRAIDEQVRQMVLDELAKKDKMSTDDFVKKEMENAKKKVSDKDVNAFLKERNVADPDKVPANLRDQVRGILHMQKLIASYTKKNPVELYLKRPQAAKIDFDTAGDADWGDKDAKVQLVEFSDFQCPYCAQGKQVLANIKKEYGKKIHIVYKHFPLPMHPDARPAAEAAVCVQEQGVDKFWKYHDMLFDNQHELGADKLKEYAKKVGADEKKFEECLASKRAAPKVDKNMEEARKLGVNSTPSFYVNSNPVRGARAEELTDLIEDILK